MAFESLTDKLQNVFKNLRSKGPLLYNIYYFRIQECSDILIILYLILTFTFIFVSISFSYIW